LRDAVTAADAEAVRSLVLGTGFFSAEEVEVAVELVEARLDQGPASGYHFLFAERAGRVVGYACYGPIALTRASYDLYWIVVEAGHRRGGVGRLLIGAVEATITDLGGGQLYVETSSRPQYAPTRAFYTRMGYREAALFEDFYAPDDGKVVFEKRLAAPHRR
jgi:D-alanine-D-alanine ligase